MDYNIETCKIIGATSLKVAFFAICEIFSQFKGGGRGPMVNTPLPTLHLHPSRLKPTSDDPANLLRIQRINVKAIRGSTAPVRADQSRSTTTYTSHVIFYKLKLNGFELSTFCE